MKSWPYPLLAGLAGCLALTGCSTSTSALSEGAPTPSVNAPGNYRIQPNVGNRSEPTYRGVNTTSQTAEVKHSTYDNKTAQVRIDAAMYGDRGQRMRVSAVPTAYRTGDNKIDLATDNGLIDFATSKYSNKRIASIHFVAHSADKTGIQRDFTISVPRSLQAPVVMGTKPSAYPVRTSPTLPPGVHRISGTGLAGTSASAAQKAQAVLDTARRQVGSTYMWGSNPQRRPRSFDTGSFTAYVYRQALGYSIPSNARAQAHSVGWQESRARWQPGDLLVFDNGSQVGVYAGHYRFLQADGSTNRVAYFSIRPDSPWYFHVTSVRRMF